MQEGREFLAPYMKNSSPEEQAALLTTYFKQGWRTMKRNYDARVAETKDTTDMRPGEGAILFYNIGAIQKVLKGASDKGIIYDFK